MGGLHWPVSLPQHVVLGHVCLQGGLHWPVSLPQHVVPGHVCFQGGLHWLMRLSQHVVAGTCLQDELRCQVLHTAGTQG